MVHGMCSISIYDICEAVLPLPNRAQLPVFVIHTQASLFLFSWSSFPSISKKCYFFLNPLLKAERLTHLLGVHIFLFSGFGDKRLSSKDHLRFRMPADWCIISIFFCLVLPGLQRLPAPFGTLCFEGRRKRRKKEERGKEFVSGTFLSSWIRFSTSIKVLRRVWAKKSPFILWSSGLNTHRVGRRKLLRLLRKPENASNLNIY